jgi:hypothetical protein
MTPQRAGCPGGLQLTVVGASHARAMGLQTLSAGHVAQAMVSPQ